MNNNITFNEGQNEAVKRIVDWYARWHDGRTQKNVFFLTGYAGTGKTSVARTAADKCTNRSTFVAPTGKAASRLRQKGCHGAKTLHQFAYNVRGEDEHGDPIFLEKGVVEERPSLLVLDEASMVGERDMAALTRHGIPVLALGDLGQIPPVKAAASLTPEHVDFELTEIMRQAENSNIIRAAKFVREGKRLPIREYDDVRVREGDIPTSELLEHSGEDGIILCSYNDSRHELNARVRDALGFHGDVPGIGEKVMCWFNQHETGFMNGEQGIILGFEQIPLRDCDMNEPEEMRYAVLKSMTDGRTRRVKFNPLSFSQDAEVSNTAIKAKGGFQYGYAATVHKAQGSEWPRVLIKEEAFRDYARIIYTAITRAQQQLTMYRVK